MVSNVQNIPKLNCILTYWVNKKGNLDRAVTMEYINQVNENDYSRSNAAILRANGFKVSKKQGSDNYAV